MRKSAAVLMMCGSVWLCGTVAAEKTAVFKCPSEDGAPSFTDQPCDDGERLIIHELPMAGLSMMVPELPPLPPKPEKPTTPEPAVHIVVVQAPLPEYDPWLNNVSYPRHHRTPPEWQPRPPISTLPDEITPPRPTPPARPIRARMELPESLQPKT